jgi:hypothetical protein
VRGEVRRDWTSQRAARVKSYGQKIACSMETRECCLAFFYGTGGVLFHSKKSTRRSHTQGGSLD